MSLEKVLPHLIVAEVVQQGVEAEVVVGVEVDPDVVEAVLLEVVQAVDQVSNSTYCFYGFNTILMNFAYLIILHSLSLTVKIKIKIQIKIKITQWKCGI